ncbi:MFS transporter [Notoacmeibacter ruber]|uniref:MFS transporter n=2 Tax=Notoacmeibacter ruber TaxID=2670375 RepID=A0A3L7JF55_9HYPH|nr:MFS transporter [Notoacmeibacter ruber]
MEQIDSTVIATALPAIATDIGTRPVALKLALTAYLVSLAIFIPISGWMADRIGSRNIFRIAIGVFILGSLSCAISSSLGQFVGARFLQGMGGAMMTPVARLILVRTTPKDRLVDAMALLTIPALIGPFLGPPLGGFITTYFSWHWIFLINLPIGLAGILLAGIFVPDMRSEDRKPIDRTGFAFAALAASGVIFGLSVISLPALPPLYGIAAVLAGLVAALLYIRHALAAPAPLLDLSLFAIRSYRSSVLGMSLFRVGSGAVPFLMPLLLQLVFGYTPFQSGLITFMGAVGALMVKFVAPAILRRTGFRGALSVTAVVGGALIAIAGFFTETTPVPVILFTLLVGGIFRSLFFTAGNALIFADIDSARAAPATATTSVLQQVSIALGVALGGAILELSTGADGIVTQTSFLIAFLTIGGLSIAAAIPFLLLPKSTGAAVSGHRKYLHVGRDDGNTRPGPAVATSSGRDAPNDDQSRSS